MGPIRPTKVYGFYAGVSSHTDVLLATDSDYKKLIRVCKDQTWKGGVSHETEAQVSKKLPCLSCSLIAGRTSSSLFARRR